MQERLCWFRLPASLVLRTHLRLLLDLTVGGPVMGKLAVSAQSLAPSLDPERALQLLLAQSQGSIMGKIPMRSRSVTAGVTGMTVLERGFPGTENHFPQHSGGTGEHGRLSKVVSGEFQEWLK